MRHLHPGAGLDYLVQAPASGDYALVIRAEARQSGNALEVAVNAKVVMPSFELVKTGWGNPTDNAPISVPLKQGFNTLRLTTRSENQGFILSSLSIR